MTTTSPAIHHLAIQVPDLNAAARFYVDVLGLPQVREQPHAIWLDAGGAIIMLERAPSDVEQASPSPPSPPPSRPSSFEGPWASPATGLFVLALTVTPAARPAFEARLAAAGVEIHHRTAFSSYFFDPFGTRLAISHYPDPLKT